MGGASGGGSSSSVGKLKPVSWSGGSSPSTGFSIIGTAQAKSSCARVSAELFLGCQLGWALSHAAQRAAVAAETLWWRIFLVMKRTQPVDAWTPTTPRLIAAAVTKSTSGTRTIGFMNKLPFPETAPLLMHKSDAELAPNSWS